MAMRKFSNLLTTVLMAIAIIGMAPVTAAQGDTDAFLKRGNAAFRAGNFEQALIEYSDALAYGNDSALLFFNMGSAHYKLGEFYQAGQAFEEAAKNEELAAVAYYNLGLIARESDNVTLARQWFGRAADTATSRGLRERANGAVTSLNRQALREQNEPRQNSGLNERFQLSFTTNLSARIGYDDNPFRSPASSYVDLSRPSQPVINPVQEAGFYVPLRFGADFSKPGRGDSRFTGEYSVSSDTYLDSALSSADITRHRLALGGEERIVAGSAEHRLTAVGVYRRHDETNFDRDDGLARTQNGQSIADRYDYDSLGLETNLDGDLDKLSYGFRLRVEKRDYEDTLGVTKYDHNYSSLGGDVSFPLTSRSDLKFDYSLYTRDYSERRSRDLLGNYSVGNPTLEYQYQRLQASFTQQYSNRLWTQYRYTRTQRNDDFVGYNDYSQDSLRFSVGYRPSSKLSSRLSISYWDRSYPNAFAYDEPTEAAKAYDEFEIRALGEYELSNQFSLYAELLWEDVGSSDARGEYARLRTTFGVSWAASR